MEKGISVILITRNEAATISTALDSLRNVADQIVIVDTGSTDDTRAIAASHPLQPEVYETEWKDDFSAARNTALAFCRCRWCMVLDADEYLDEACRSSVRQLVETNLEKDPQSLYAPLIDNLNGNLLRNNPRIFQRRDTLKYYGRVHEYLSDQSNAKVVALHDIVIKHTGYLPEIHDQDRKHERNIRLLRKQIKEDPDLYRWKYFLLRYIDIQSHEAISILNDFGRLPLPYPSDIEVYAFNAKSCLIHNYIKNVDWGNAYEHVAELYNFYKDYDTAMLYISAKFHYACYQLRNTLDDCENILTLAPYLQKDEYLHERTSPELMLLLRHEMSTVRSGLYDVTEE
jgi:glycosyltransferase involved in cell wall biosynthesis